MKNIKKILSSVLLSTTLLGSGLMISSQAMTPKKVQDIRNFADANVKSANELCNMAKMVKSPDINYAYRLSSNLNAHAAKKFSKAAMAYLNIHETNECKQANLAAILAMAESALKKAELNQSLADRQAAFKACNIAYQYYKLMGDNEAAQKYQEKAIRTRRNVPVALLVEDNQNYHNNK